DRKHVSLEAHTVNSLLDLIYDIGCQANSYFDGHCWNIVFVEKCICCGGSYSYSGIHVSNVNHQFAGSPKTAANIQWTGSNQQFVFWSLIFGIGRERKNVSVV